MGEGIGTAPCMCERTVGMYDDWIDEDAAAEELLHRYGACAARRGAPVWLKVENGGFGLCAAEVDRTEGLLGQTVEPWWPAVAVVGTGRFRLLDPAHEPPAGVFGGLAGGLTMAGVVTRHGQIGWRLQLPDGSFFDPVPEEGFMLDVLRRSLELPTPPPPESTGRLQMAAWIAAILDTEPSRRRLRWEDALGLHPCMDGDPVRTVVEAEAILEELCVHDGWDSIRRAVAAGMESEQTPPPDLAEWMDAGMFARWVLCGLPDLESLMPEVRVRLQVPAYRRLLHFVKAVKRTKNGSSA